MLSSFECASSSTLLKRTAAITQAGLGSQTIRSGTVAFETLHCVIEVAYVFASVKAIPVKCLVWENTAHKELQPLELQARELQNLPVTPPLGDCIKDVIAELTLYAN